MLNSKRESTVQWELPGRSNRGRHTEDNSSKSVHMSKKMLEQSPHCSHTRPPSLIAKGLSRMEVIWYHSECSVQNDTHNSNYRSSLRADVASTLQFLKKSEAGFGRAAERRECTELHQSTIMNASGMTFTYPQHYYPDKQNCFKCMNRKTAKCPFCLRILNVKQLIEYNQIVFNLFVSYAL